MSIASNFLKKIPQYTRGSRHLRSVMQHGNPRKWSNLALAEAERKMRRIHLKSYPYLLIIDPCNFCNLKCPLCPTGTGELGRPQKMLSLEHFKRYFDPVAPYLFEAYMHSWGESMLNKEVFEMIDYAQQHDVGTNLSSNLSATTSDQLDKLIDSGLEYLVVSLDGTTQEVYEKYRVRGKIDNVFHNMSELIRRRNERGRKTPVIEWQFIVMKQNEHQIPEAEKLAKKIGVDLLRFIPVGLPYEMKNRKAAADEWFPVGTQGREDSTHTEQTFGISKKPGPCFYLYRSLVINPDGGVAPCCVVYKKNRDFAELGGETYSLDDLWNNEKYLSARSLYSGKIIADRKPTVCDGCDIFARHPSKELKPRKQVEPAAVEVS